ncbi:hypothetical protein EDB83DRAFT_2529124 [Lactarius deliciosus]|nr:hypothetical protein EDB83DRAFT_2529124 [Lactarius deliciosus]
MSFGTPHTTHSNVCRPAPFPFIPGTLATIIPGTLATIIPALATIITIHIPIEGYHYPKAASPAVSGRWHNFSVLSLHPEYNIKDTTLEPELRVSARKSPQNIRRTFHLTQLQHSSLHLEKRLIRQKIQEHEISLQALKERMADVENDIVSTTDAVGTLHCYMDEAGISVPDMAEDVAASIVFSEDEDDDASDSQDGDASDSQDQTLEDAATSETVPSVMTL